MIGDQEKRHCDDRIRRHGRGNGQRHSVGQRGTTFVTKSNLEGVGAVRRLNNMFCPDSLRPDRRRADSSPMKLMCRK